MRIGDLDHLKSRVVFTGDPEKDLVASALVRFIDSEETCTNEIDWLPYKKIRKTKEVMACTFGFVCNRCGNFESYKKRYCSSCGGHFNGELDIIAKNTRRFYNGHNRKSKYYD